MLEQGAEYGISEKERKKIIAWAFQWLLASITKVSTYSLRRVRDKSRAVIEGTIKSGKVVQYSI
jgi:hypothetical protein